MNDRLARVDELARKARDARSEADEAKRNPYLTDAQRREASRKARAAETAAAQAQAQAQRSLPLGGL